MPPIGNKIETGRAVSEALYDGTIPTSIVLCTFSQKTYFLEVKEVLGNPNPLVLSGYNLFTKPEAVNFGDSPNEFLLPESYLRKGKKLPGERT